MTSVLETHSAAPAESSSGAAHFDAQCALLAMLVLSQSSTQSGARKEVELDYKKLEELKAQLAEALQQAQEANDDSGFWGFLSDVFGSDVAQVAGAVAAAAAVIATGGAAAPLLLIVISAALETGAEVGAELGLDPKVCLAISIAGAAIGLCSGVGAGASASTLSEAAQTAKTVSRVATTVQGAATIAGGATGYVSGRYAADAADHQADASYIGGQRNATDMDIDEAFAELERSLRVQSSMSGTVAQIGQDNARAGAALANNV